jgi:hypothetical protein
MNHLHIQKPSSRSGSLLLELILAMTLFAICVIPLASALNEGLEAASLVSRENSIRIGLRSFVEEQRRKQVSDMPTQTTDDQLGVTYTSTVDDLTIKNVDGTVLTDLYVLHAKAEWDDGAHEESVDLYLYEPSGQNINSTPTGGTASTSSTSGSSTSGSGQ